MVNPVGQEDLKHLTAEELCRTLRFVEGAEVLGKWCALLRADEEHPSNHNALFCRNIMLDKQDFQGGVN